MAKIARLDPKLSAGRTGLVLFDALNGYLHPDNPAKVQFLAERNIIANMQRLLRGAHAVGMTAFYPSGAHAPDGSDTVDRLSDTNMDLMPGGSAEKPIRPHFHKGRTRPRLRPNWRLRRATSWCRNSAGAASSRPISSCSCARAASIPS